MQKMVKTEANNEKEYIRVPIPNADSSLCIIAEELRTLNLQLSKLIMLFDKSKK